MGISIHVYTQIRAYAYIYMYVKKDSECDKRCDSMKRNVHGEGPLGLEYVYVSFEKLKCKGV